MKRIMIIVPYKKLYRAFIYLAAFILLACTVFILKITPTGFAPALSSTVDSQSEDRAKGSEDSYMKASAFNFANSSFDSIEVDEIEGLERENSRLNGVLKSIIPEDNKIIYEDQFRNSFLNAKGYTLPSIQAVPLRQVLNDGKEINFKVLTNRPNYLRPLYDPGWKGFYFRGWLCLPRKNIEARHRLFIYPGGGSSIFDFTGTLGLEDSTAVDYHRNINFLVYDFNVKSIKLYKNKAALTGETSRTGLQIISVVQDDLLPDGLDTNDILFHLSTPEGYEIDYDYGNVIRYEHLKRKIKENSVEDIYREKPVSIMPDGLTASRAPEDISASRTQDGSPEGGVRDELPANNMLDELLEENLKLKRELTLFMPFEDKVIYQNKCKPIPPNFPLDPDIETMLQRGKVFRFNKIYSNKTYERPVYDPAWYENRNSRWCFIPKQICNNLHRVFLIPQNVKDRLDFFGTLGFHEIMRPVNSDEYSFIVYNFKTERTVTYDDHLLFVGTPSRTGAEIVTIAQSNLPGSNPSGNNSTGSDSPGSDPSGSDPSGSDPSGKRFYIARLVTPDNQELDYVVMQ